jgi:hypothetical protein
VVCFSEVFHTKDVLMKKETGWIISLLSTPQQTAAFNSPFICVVPALPSVANTFKQTTHGQIATAGSSAKP